MSGFQLAITIYDAMRHIEQKEYLLPAFQREFVWSQEQIERLFDSLMQSYPISSMLFWKVKDSTRTDFNFYRFLDKYVLNHHTHNEKQEVISKDFNAVLDGQQRLTALYLGLFGSYASHEYRKSWEYSPSSFPERKLYLCISRTNSDEDNDRKYLFSFLKTDVTDSKDLYIAENDDIWFRVGKIVDLHLSFSNIDIDDFCDDNELSKENKKMLRQLEKIIFTEHVINYYEEEDQNPDKVVNIFTRINSGGTNLSLYDIMFSLTVANWKKDARTEITGLIDRINNKGFNIGIDYVLKSFLFLYHKRIKYSINSFSTDFCKLLEDKWEGVRDCIESLFDLLRSFGFNSTTLTSYNATLPILYYLYHKGISKNFTNVIAFDEDRKKIKKWLLSVILRKGFGGQSDNTLTSARKAFTDDIENLFINDMLCFPAEEINKNISRHLEPVDDDLINSLLATQKDHQYCFPILAVLYPNLDYKNGNFHKDHLHPAASYDLLPDEIKEKYSWYDYNSIVNLQMLDANENESKNAKALNVWVDEQIEKTENRAQFFDSHLIPNINLSLENFDEFYTKRKELLSEKLKQLIE